MENKEYLKEIKKLPNNNIIYGLSDPNSNEVRYVGKAVDLYTRIRNHYKPSRLKFKTHKNNWLNNMLINNKFANVIILEICESEKELNECEIKWIKYYRELGYDLTNATDGGDGGKMSPESIEKMRMTKIGVKLSNDHKLKISEGNKGRIVSEETRKKLSKSRKKYIVSDETKEKMKLARLNYLANINSK